MIKATEECLQQIPPFSSRELSGRRGRNSVRAREDRAPRKQSPPNQYNQSSNELTKIEATCTRPAGGLHQVLCIYIKAPMFIFMGFLSVWTGMSRILVPSLVLIYLCLFALFNSSLTVLLLFHYEIFYYYPVEVCLFFNVRPKGNGSKWERRQRGIRQKREGKLQSGYIIWEKILFFIKEKRSFVRITWVSVTNIFDSLYSSKVFMSNITFCYDFICLWYWNLENVPRKIPFSSIFGKKLRISQA